MLSAGRHQGSERGSVLILVPAGFLVLLLLGGISVDSAVTYLGQRQLADTAAAAANDAATVALGNSAFYGTGTLAVDPARAAQAVCRTLVAQGGGSLHDEGVDLAVAGPVVRVRLYARVTAVFGRIIPGYGQRRVSAEATATAVSGGAGVDTTQPGNLVPIVC